MDLEQKLRLAGVSDEILKTAGIKQIVTDVADLKSQNETLFRDIETKKNELNEAIKRRDSIAKQRGQIADSLGLPEEKRGEIVEHFEVKMKKLKELESFQNGFIATEKNEVLTLAKKLKEDKTKKAFLEIAGVEIDEIETSIKTYEDVKKMKAKLEKINGLKTAKADGDSIFVQTETQQQTSTTSSYTGGAKPAGKMII
jgi:outer membrane murein-binding lipoprotein Lpp